MKIIGNKQ